MAQSQNVCPISTKYGLTCGRSVYGGGWIRKLAVERLSLERVLWGIFISGTILCQLVSSNDVKWQMGQTTEWCVHEALGMLAPDFCIESA